MQAFDSRAPSAADAWQELLFAALQAESSGRRTAEPRGLEQLAAEVRRAGHAARVVRTAMDEQGELSLPTVCSKRDGRLVLVSRRTRGKTHVLEADGSTRVLPTELAAELSGDALDLAPALPARGGVLRRLLTVLTGERRLLTQLGAATLTALLLGLAAPMLTAWVMDRALPQGDRGLLWVLTLAMFGLRVHQQWLEWLRARAGVALEGSLESALLRYLPEHLLRVPYAVAARAAVGAQLEALELGVGGARVLVTTGLLPLLDGALALCFVALLVTIEPSLALVAFLLTATSAVATVLAAGPLNAIRDARAQAGGEQRSALLELVSGAAGIRAAGAERGMFGRWVDRFLAERAAELRLGRTEASFEAWLEIAHKLSRVAAFTWCGSSAIDGQMTIGVFLACAAYTDGYVGAAHRVLRAIIPLVGARRDAERVDAYLATPALPEPVRLPPTALEESADAIVFEDVWFRYGEDAPWILAGVNLRVARGEFFALNGVSGSGKTTMLRLIAGLLTPERGSVRVAGRDPVRARSAVAYLPQEPYLFAGTIGSNLRLLSGADYERLEWAARQTGLAQQLAALPMGVETVVPPGGGTLSGGQRQLVLLTAAAASERPIVLLDESLAHLDRLTRAALLECPAFRGRTVVTVEHEPPEGNARGVLA